MKILAPSIEEHAMQMRLAGILPLSESENKSLGQSIWVLSMAGKLAIRENNCAIFTVGDLEKKRDFDEFGDEARFRYLLSRGELEVKTSVGDAEVFDINPIPKDVLSPAIGRILFHTTRSAVLPELNATLVRNGLKELGEPLFRRLYVIVAKEIGDRVPEPGEVDEILTNINGTLPEKIKEWRKNYEKKNQNDDSEDRGKKESRTKETQKKQKKARKRKPKS